MRHRFRTHKSAVGATETMRRYLGGPSLTAGRRAKRAEDLLAQRLSGSGVQ